ncbi:MAG: Ig-like domain repeat protein [Rhodanobacteraceae bacterium]|nr:Ig-like domain repeat protein [Rhodanobacteraceae bacterium]
MIKRVMLWAALVSTTSAMAAEPLSLDAPYPARRAAMPASFKAMPGPLAKAVLADINESAKLVASNPAALDHFGYRVAIDGNTAVVGAFEKDGANVDVGAAYVYLRTGNSWALQAQLTTPTTVEGAAFGRDVAVSGDTIAVGAPFDDHTQAGSGAVYIFTRSGSVWTQRAKLGANATSGDRFGWSVALEGSTLAIGAPADETASFNNAGAAYVFTGSDATWTQQGSALAASDAQDSDLLGVSIAVSGDNLIVGAEGVDTVAETNVDSGAAYVFTRAANIWTQRTRLRAASPAENNLFGRSVAIDGSTVIVGEPGRLSNTGAAHVFVGSGASWNLQQLLTASDAATGDVFGQDVAIRGDLALVGAYEEEASSGPLNRGAIYVWRRSGGAWTQPDKFLASDATTGDRFGFGLALTPSAAIAGAPNDANGSFSEAGSAYVFHLGTPTTTIQILNPVPATFGGILGLSAQVTGGTPTGNVEFRNGATVLASVALNGSGVAATTITPNAGAYSVTAFYLGDGTHLSSNSSATAFTVAKATTSLSLGSNNSPSTYGQNVTFTATVSTTAPGASPVTGSVEFRDNGVLLATVPLSSGTASHTTNALPHNTGIAHPITASFIANTNYTASTGSTINHVVNKAVPTLTLVSNPNPSLFGQSVAITGTLSGGLAPTGTVTFFDGITLMGSNNVVAGVATRNTSALALGAHSLQATYAGDDNHDSANTSAPTVHNVLPSADVSVTKTNGTSFVQSGLDTTYTIVVNNPAGGADTDGLLVNDTLNPAQFDVPNADWSCAPAGICTPESGTGNLANLPLDLPAGSSVTITVTVPVLPEAESGVSNTVSLTMPVDVGDPNPSNNTATDSDGSGLFNDGFESGPAS